MKILIIFLILFPQTKTQEKNEYVNNYMNIKKEINIFCNSQNPMSSLKALIKYFKINEGNKNDKYYLPNNYDFKLLWKFEDSLFEKCKRNYILIKYYLQLDNVHWRNVEFSEGLRYSFYNVALDAPKNILLSLKILNEKQREHLLRNLDMLKEVDKVDTFIKKIQEIKDKSLDKYKAQILKHFQ